MYFNMKPFLRIIILMLLAVQANAQCLPVPLPKGPDTTFGTYTIYVTGVGAFGGGGGLCPGPVGEYRIGVGPGGSYLYTFSKPVYGLNVRFVGLNRSEYIHMNLNGLPYTITAANMVSYLGCISSPGGALCFLSGGDIYGPSLPGGTLSDYGGGEFQLTSCNPIRTFEIYCNGTVGGVDYYLCTDTLRRDTCIKAFSNAPMCEGNDLSLRAMGDSAGATYYWYGPAGFTSTSKRPYILGATPANTGLYTVVKTVGPIHDTDTINVWIKPIPALTVTSNAPICYGVGNTLNLFASPFVPGETFSWTGPNSFSSTLQNPTVTGFADADTGFYTVVVDKDGCGRSATIHVVYAPIPPAPVISGPTAYCTGQPFVPFTVMGTGGGTILWYTTGVGGTGSSTAPVVNTTVAGVYTYWASQTILGCESPRSSITVTVNPTPAMPVITGTAVFCQFDAYVAPTATGTGILWYTALSGGVGAPAPSPVPTSTPGTYNVYATQSAGGCESPRATFTMTVRPKPSPPVVVASPDTYCPGQPFVPFSVISGTGILWYTVPTGGTGSSVAPILSTNTSGVQTVYVSQTVLGCESPRAAVSITVEDSVKADFIPIIKWGCKADTVIFQNTSKQTTTYYWKFGDGFSSHLEEPTHVYLVQSLDTVKLYASVSTCIDSTTQILDLRHPLHSRFEMDTNLICQGKTITFSDSVSEGRTGFTYLWEYGDNMLHPPVTTPNTSHTYSMSGVYKAFLVVTDDIPCTDTMFKTIYVDSISRISFKLTDTVICKGTYITANGTFSKIGNTGLTWDMGNNDSVQTANPLVYAYSEAGVYDITARAYYRVCPNPTATRKMTVIAQPKIDLGPSEVSICKGSQAMTLYDQANQGNPLASWEWSNGQKTSSIDVVEPGVYTATVKLNGCFSSGTVTVKNDCYMNIPNAFTPNDDGSNDYFCPRDFLFSGLTAFHMAIYNRWGQMVFETNALNGRGWDGKMNDLPQPQGVYVYLVEGTFKDGQKERHQGNLTLLR